jgi:hypothetical protein
MTAKELGLDYLNFYDVANQPAGQVIGLQGQFDKHGAEKVQLTYLNLFANPASKNGEPVHDENAHFSWYDLYDPTPDPVRRVDYENQWGRSQLITGRAYALLVPTWKVEQGHEYPEKADHYKLYQVLQGEPINQEATLRDQWHEGRARIFDPIFFGVPVQKFHEGGTVPIQNERAHLVIYRVYPHTVQKAVPTRDQFGQRYVNAFRHVLLGAPSLKTDWQEL